MKKHLWEGLNRWKKDHDISEQDMIDRILFVQALDTLRFWQLILLRVFGLYQYHTDLGIGSLPQSKVHTQCQK
jgi:hypothetical protein